MKWSIYTVIGCLFAIMIMIMVLARKTSRVPGIDTLINVDEIIQNNKYYDEYHYRQSDINIIVYYGNNCYSCGRGKLFGILDSLQVRYGNKISVVGIMSQDYSDRDIQNLSNLLRNSKMQFVRIDTDAENVRKRYSQIMDIDPFVGSYCVHRSDGRVEFCDSIIGTNIGIEKYVKSIVNLLEDSV